MEVSTRQRGPHVQEELRFLEDDRTEGQFAQLARLFAKPQRPLSPLLPTLLPIIHPVQSRLVHSLSCVLDGGSSAQNGPCLSAPLLY